MDALKKVDPNVFCKLYLKSESVCDVIVSNTVEIFYSYIMNARSKHLINMLDDIRTMLMKMIVTKRKAAMKWNGVLFSKVQALVDKERKVAAKCTVMPFSANVFQVSHYLDTLEVDLEMKCCTYRKWDLKGIPCCYVVAAIFYLHKDVESYVDQLHQGCLLFTYSGSISPITRESHWPP